MAAKLTPRQAAAGWKLIRKYRRQYAPELYQRMFPERRSEETDGTEDYNDKARREMAQ